MYQWEIVIMDEKGDVLENVLDTTIQGVRAKAQDYVKSLDTPETTHELLDIGSPEGAEQLVKASQEKKPTKKTKETKDETEGEESEDQEDTAQEV